MKNRARSFIILTILLTLLIGVSIFWLREPKPAFDDTDLKPVRTQITLEDDAFPVLTRIASQVRWLDERHAPQIAGMAGSSKNWEWDQELAEQLLASNQEVLGLLDQVLPQLVSPSPPNPPSPAGSSLGEGGHLGGEGQVSKLQVPASNSFDDEYPYLSDWARIAQLVSIRSAALYREGREREAFELAFRLVELGHSIEDSEGATIHYRRGALIKMMGLSRIRLMTPKTSLPADYLMQLSKRVSGYTVNARALTNALKTDYQLNVALVQDFSVGRLPGTNGADPVIRTFGMPMLNVEKTKQFFAGSARVVMENIPRNYAQMRLGQFRPASTNSSVSTTLTKIVRGNVIGEVLVDLMQDSLPRLLARKCEENVAVGATELVLALKSYQMHQGTLPDSLSDLVPNYLAAVPLDDFDGKPLRYSRDKYLVYSVGWNLTDDGGEERNAQKERQDIVFTLDF